MASPSVTYTFTNSTPADGTQVNTNFTDLINAMSDGTKDFSISALTVAGSATLNGAVTLGNASGDDITFTGSLASTITIKVTNSYDIGANTLGIRGIYFGSSDSAANSTKVIAGSLAAANTVILPETDTTFPAADGSDGDYLKTNGSGVLSFITGPLLTQWAAYTPSGAWGTSGIGWSGFWRRVGDTMQVRGMVTPTGSVTGTFTFSIPSGYTIDTAKLDTVSAGLILGTAGGRDGAAVIHVGIVTYESTTVVRIYGDDGLGAWSATVPFTWANSDKVFLKFEVPITDWV